MRILVTGAAGFIGSFVSKKLSEHHEVLGLDNLSTYYDINLKLSRLEFLKPLANFRFEKVDITDRQSLENLIREFKPQKIVHLAAQAGVRYSLTHPHVYGETNLTGFLNIIEIAKLYQIEHFIYASTSSVYGLGRKLPFSVNDPVAHPASLYAATKRANELMAHSYSHMFKLPTTGLRFFTVYGPYGRPDMALFIFSKNMLKGEPIEVFNYGKHRRDFTFVDDIVEGVCRVTLSEPPSPSQAFRPESPNPSLSSAPFKIYNIGNSNPVELNTYIEILETNLGVKAIRTELPLQNGDILETVADISELEQDFNYRPKTSVHEGIKQFVNWYRNFYGV